MRSDLSDLSPSPPPAYTLDEWFRGNSKRGLGHLHWEGIYLADSAEEDTKVSV